MAVVASAEPLAGRLLRILSQYVADSLAELSIAKAAASCDVAPRMLHLAERSQLLAAVEQAARPWIRDPSERRQCALQLRGAILGAALSVAGEIPIHRESDIMHARHTLKKECEELGFRLSDQVKITTVVSELARNIVEYAESGTIHYRTLCEPRRGLEIVAEDHGPGIKNVDKILAGTYRSRTGMSRGLLSAQRMMDCFDLESEPGCTIVTVSKYCGATDSS